MSEQVGEVFIEVAARIDKLESGLAAAKEAAIKAAGETAASFSETMEQQITDGAQLAGESAAGALKDAISTENRDEIVQIGKELGEDFSAGFEGAASQVNLTPMAEKVGDSTGQSFGKRLSSRIASSWGEAGQDQFAKIGAKLLGPMAAAKFADGFASVLRSDKNIGEAVNDALLSIPFVGSFVNLGNAIYESTFGAADKAAADLIAKQEAARGGMLKAASAREAESQAAQQAAGAMKIETARLALSEELNEARRSGDERAIALAEYNLAIKQQEFELGLKIAQEVSDEELNAFLKLNAEKRKALELERDLKLQSIDEAAEEQKLADDQEFKDKMKSIEDQRKADLESQIERTQSAEDSAEAVEAELEYRRSLVGASEEEARAAKERYDSVLRAAAKEKELREATSDEEREQIERRFAAQEELDKVMSDIEASSRQAASVGSAQTALGTFTFDPYPAARQKEVQERTMRAVEKSASLSGQVVGFS